MAEKCTCTTACVTPQANYHELILSALEHLGRAVEGMNDFVLGVNGESACAAIDSEGDTRPTLHQVLMNTPVAIISQANRIDELRERLYNLLYGR